MSHSTKSDVEALLKLSFPAFVEKTFETPRPVRACTD